MTANGHAPRRGDPLWRKTLNNGTGAWLYNEMCSPFPPVGRLSSPFHTSWLNQVEVYFSLLQRKVLTPNDSTDLQELRLRIKLYEELTNRQPKPFNWRFTKYDLFRLLQRLAQREAAARRSTPGPPASRE
jgi:hypothetical protein